MFISQFTVREDSQIDSAMGSVGFALRGGGRGGGGVKEERFSNFGNNRFLKWRNYRKNLVSKGEYYR